MSEPVNPYRLPASPDAEVFVPADQLERAGRGRRFGTLLIDYVGYFVLAFVTGIILAIFDGAQSFEGLSEGGQLLFSLGLFAAYYLFFETLFARTPGKMICGTRVVNMDGGAPSFGQVLGRTLSRFIPFEAFSFLFCDDRDVHGWHDSLPKTRVVLVRK